MIIKIIKAAVLLLSLNPERCFVICKLHSFYKVGAPQRGRKREEKGMTLNRALLYSDRRHIFSVDLQNSLLFLLGFAEGRKILARREALKVSIVRLSPVPPSVFTISRLFSTRLGTVEQLRKKSDSFKDFFLYYLSVEQNENTEMNESDCEGKKAIGE